MTNGLDGTPVRRNDDGLSQAENDELIEIISALIGIRNREVSREFAERVLRCTNHQFQLIDLTIDQLVSVRGIGVVRARRIHAACRLARVYLEKTRHVSRVTSDDQLSAWLRAQVPIGQRVLLAHKNEVGHTGIMLAAGDSLHQFSPLGHYLMPLISQRETVWSITYVRNGGPPTHSERAIGGRIEHVASLLGISINSFSVLAGRKFRRLV